MILIDDFGNRIKPKGIDKETDRFIPSEESISAKIARNIYKPVREVGSAAIGAIPSMWNLLASGANIAVPTLNRIASAPAKALGLERLLGIQRLSRVPLIPDEATISGLKEGPFKSLGESIFGKGSQDPQPGFVEGLTDRASQVLPFALLGPGGVGRAIGTSGLQALGGEVVKKLGGGQLAQLAGEIGLGIGVPTISALASSRIPKAASALRRSLIEKGREQISKAGSIPVKSFYDSANRAMNLAKETLSSSERGFIARNLGEIESVLGPESGTAPIKKLINVTKKLKGVSNSIKSSSGKKIISNLNNSIINNLDEAISVRPEIRKLSRAINQHPFFNKMVDKAGQKSKGIISSAISLGKYGALPLAYGLGGVKGAVGLLGTGGLVIGKKALDNAKLLKSSPKLFKLSRELVSDIAKGNLTTAARKVDAISKRMDGKDYKKLKSSMILI